MAQSPLVEWASNASHFPMVQGVIHRLYQSPFLQVPDFWLFLATLSCDASSA